MRSAIHILYGDGRLQDKQQYALRHVGEERTLILLSEIDEYRQYAGFNRNVQIGLGTDELMDLNFLSYEVVIFEAFDEDEFEWFLGMTDKLNNYLNSDGKKLFILLNKDVSLKPTESVEVKERKLDTEIGCEGENIKEIVMQRIEK